MMSEWMNVGLSQPRPTGQTPFMRFVVDLLRSFLHSKANFCADYRTEQFYNSASTAYHFHLNFAYIINDLFGWNWQLSEVTKWNILASTKCWNVVETTWRCELSECFLALDYKIMWYVLHVYVDAGYVVLLFYDCKVNDFTYSFMR